MRFHFGLSLAPPKWHMAGPANQVMVNLGLRNWLHEVSFMIKSKTPNASHKHGCYWIWLHVPTGWRA